MIENEKSFCCNKLGNSNVSLFLAWSACYDEASGFTYYWNQKTNAVTWEAPPEYLLALKVAQQQLAASGKYNFVLELSVHIGK